VVLAVPGSLDERGRNLLEQVERVLQAVFHAGRKDGVAVLLTLELHQHVGRRASVVLMEGQYVQPLPFGRAFELLRVDDAFVGDELAVLTVKEGLWARPQEWGAGRIRSALAAGEHASARYWAQPGAECFFRPS
jgi:hypothetical protein